MDYHDNIRAYLRWRGDLTLAKSPFNEVDSLILSEIAYVALDGIVPAVGEKGSITIAEAVGMFRKQHTEEELKADPSQTWEAPFLFLELGESKRFRDMTLDNYVNRVDYAKTEQFAAFHVNLGNGLIYIVFRGTEDALVGWKENFNMSYMMPVPSQKAAVDYVNETARGWFKKYRLGGHSKGGNLAVYAGVFCNAKIQKKIVQIHSFDGPGFNRKMVDDPEYLEMKEKIVFYVPESSVIGMLMEHQEDYLVVKSEETGIWQHNAMSWQVEGDALVLGENRDASSEFADETINAWLRKITPRERALFIDAFFEVLEQAEIHTVSDLTSLNLKKTMDLAKAMSTTSKENRDIILKIIQLLLEEGNLHMKKKLPDKKKLHGIFKGKVT